MNLLCGAMGVIFTFQGALDIAFYLMLAGAVCDFFDGFAARLLNAYTAMGKGLNKKLMLSDQELCSNIKIGGRGKRSMI